MTATYKTVFPACGPAVWAADGRRAYRGGTSGPSYDAEASSYFTRASITDATAKTAINDWIAGVKSGLGLSLLSDAFDQIAMQGNETSGAAVADWTGNELDQSLINSPTFTQWRGVTRAGATDYIDTNFNPVSVAGNFALNSHSFGVYFRAPTSGGASNGMGVINGSFQGYQIWNNNSGNFLGSDGSTSTNLDVSNGGDQTGLISVSRTASNATAIYRDATSMQALTFTPNVGLLNLNFFIIGRNQNGSLGNAATGTSVAFSFFGRGFTAGEMAIISAHTDTLATALGWNV